jgi:hypothetical protein
MIYDLNRIATEGSAQDLVVVQAYICNCYPTLALSCISFVIIVLLHLQSNPTSIFHSCPTKLRIARVPRHRVELEYT